MNILFEDKHIIVCVKPRGILSQQDDKKKNMADELSAVTDGEIYPVHRLDKETGGVMVYAKTKFAAAELSKQVSERTMTKKYFAVVKAHDGYDVGIMEDLLYFDKSKNKAFTVKRERRGVKKAVLEYRLVKSVGEQSLYDITLLTGRTHQVRVQFASRGMALSGDRRYGGDDAEIIALWAYSLSFAHPVTGEIAEFTVNPEEAVFKQFL